ncbi:LysO family transporter [Desulfohalobium retbaense]|uniref:DUF340 domain-containing protein n=1 Tax=Desulfohalobium retbaense (strain ATCC 49708 / DSM 5692 / JCM 16813 / HR100) TaxID=485915 RepID=C8WZ76_DESRD|nr:LysO family transporter [Desulfohalobium retbaense]ACV67351.1 conserved hypothetical protein [Desulfohalobium retbaense DSM 5692]
MLYILGCFLGGLAVGFAMRRQQHRLKPVGRLTDAAVCFLLFVLGAKLGANETVMDNLGQLGWEALWLTLGAVLGSLLAVRPLERLLKGEVPESGGRT